MGHIGQVALKKPSTLIALGNVFATPVPPVFSAEYQAVIDKATALGYTKPSLRQQILQDDLMQAWIASGLFAKADVLYMMANDVGLDFARINWKDPNSYTLTNSGVVSYLSNYGPYTNPETPSGGALNTGWSPSVGVNFTLDSNSMVFSLLSGYAGSGTFCRAGVGTNAMVMYSLDYIRAIFNNSAGSPSNPAAHNNFSWMNRRTASNAVQLLYAVEAGGSAITNINDTAVTTSRTASLMGLIGDLASGLGTFNVGVPMDVFFIGAALTDTEFVNYDTALKTYLNKIRYSRLLATLGAGNYTVPAGITQLLVECWGGGGAGRGFANVAATKTGAGGAGGAYAASLINVIPGAIIPIIVGAGGLGNAVGTGGVGGDTSWNGGVVLAKGGAGGSTVDSDHSNGGSAASSVGTTKFSGGGGGSQGTVLNASTGSGGSGAGPFGNGLNGIDAVAASGATTRVNYNRLGPGVPGYSLSNATDGNGIPGMLASGGGGARRATLARSGGNGGQGYIRVSATKSY